MQIVKLLLYLAAVAVYAVMSGCAIVYLCESRKAKPTSLMILAALCPLVHLWLAFRHDKMIKEDEDEGLD